MASHWTFLPANLPLMMMLSPVLTGTMMTNATDTLGLAFSTIRVILLKCFERKDPSGSRKWSECVMAAELDQSYQLTLGCQGWCWQIWRERKLRIDATINHYIFPVQKSFLPKCFHRKEGCVTRKQPECIMAEVGEMHPGKIKPVPGSSTKIT